MIFKETKETLNKVAIQYMDKYWGIEYEDSHSTSYGWVGIENAKLSDPRYCKNPEDVTYPGSHYISELRKGKLVNVERTTVWTISDIKL